jgi:hypothetical protein
MNSDAEIKRKAAEILFIVFACIVCIAVLVMLRRDAFFPSHVFINESDHAQTIELKVNSRLNSLIREPLVHSAAAGFLENRSACLNLRPKEQSVRDNSFG